MWLVYQQRRSIPFSPGTVTLVWHLKPQKLLPVDTTMFHFISVWIEKQKAEGLFFQVSSGRKMKLLEDEVYTAYGFFESLIVSRNFLFFF